MFNADFGPVGQRHHRRFIHQWNHWQQSDLTLKNDNLNCNTFCGGKKIIRRKAWAKSSLPETESCLNCDLGSSGAKLQNTLIAMTKLNSRLQPTLLNGKKFLSLLKTGFTLVELLIVVVILGVLSGVALPSFLSQRDKANVSAANAQGKQLMAACQLENVEATPDYENIDANLQTAKTFGAITWTPTVSSSACSAVTTGATTTQGSWSLNTTTGVVTVTEAE